MTTHMKKVRSIPFNKDQSVEVITELMEIYRDDKRVIGLPFFGPTAKSRNSFWQVKNECKNCGYKTTQRVDHLINYELGCKRCHTKNLAEDINATVAKRVVAEGRVSFNRDMDSDDVATIMKEHRPDRKILESPFYKLVKNKNSGYWYVKNECGDCGHVSTQKVYSLVNYNLGCRKCGHGRL